MMPIIISAISLIFDGIFSNFLPYMKNDLSFFTPLLTVSSLFLLYPFYRKTPKRYYLHAFLLGIIYDLFYTNLLFFDGILFLGVALLSKILYKNLEVHSFSLIFHISLIIIFYESFTAFLLFFFHLVPITISFLIYKIIHSLLLNIIYIEIIYFLLKLIPKRYKKISIN